MIYSFGTLNKEEEKINEFSPDVVRVKLEPSKPKPLEDSITRDLYTISCEEYWGIY